MTWAPMPEVGERQSGSSIEYMKAKEPVFPPRPTQVDSSMATLKYHPSMNLPWRPLVQWYWLWGVSSLHAKAGSAGFDGKAPPLPLALPPPPPFPRDLTLAVALGGFEANSLHPLAGALLASLDRSIPRGVPKDNVGGVGVGGPLRPVPPDEGGKALLVIFDEPVESES
mmetsp:Transcript_30072/g.64211  ORF Transcript_30072/g.64211 Transcript_30072/m.64211 type:complete len:169 (+) Transcript_30072:460-966(+)